MKLKHTLIAAALAFVLAAGLRAQTATAPAAAAPAASGEKAPAPHTDAQVLEMIGWYVVANSPVGELDAADAALKDAFLKGARLALEGKPAPFDEQKIGPDVQRFVIGRMEAQQKKMKDEADKAAEKFFAELKKNPNIKALPSGVMYEILKPGSGEFPTINDTVTIHYLGTLTNGSKFDSSYDRREPASFPLRGIIPGMTEGLQKINKGGKIKIYIPSEQGYGEQASQQIPPFSILVFEVELLDFTATPVPPPGAGPADE